MTHTAACEALEHGPLVCRPLQAICKPCRTPILMSPDINRPFCPFPRHSFQGLMSGARLCWPGFGAGFVRIPMEKPPNRHVPRQKTAATRPFLSGARHHPESKIRPLKPCCTVMRPVPVSCRWL